MHAGPVRGRLRFVLFSWKRYIILKFKFTTNFSPFCSNHNDQPRSVIFIMVVLKLSTTNEALKYWEKHKGRVKFSFPHGIHCFKGLSRAESYSGGRQGVNKPT